jgi:raffinose/stachyose/melibiose transport system permease protein
VLRHVIWPYLRPVAAVAIAINLIGGWKVFDIVYVLTNGGPANSSQVLSTDLYQEAFSFDNLAYASTIGLVIMALAVVSVLAQRRIARTT